MKAQTQLSHVATNKSDPHFIEACIYLLCTIFARLQVGLSTNSLVASFYKDDVFIHYQNHLEIMSYIKKQKKDTKTAKVTPFLRIHFTDGTENAKMRANHRVHNFFILRLLQRSTTKF